MTATSKPPADLSPIAACLIIAARRGRALRLQREAQRAAQHAAEQPRRDDAPQARHDDQAAEVRDD